MKIKQLSISLVLALVLGFGVVALAQTPTTPATPVPAAATIAVPAVTVTPATPKEVQDAGPAPEVAVTLVQTTEEAKAQIPTNIQDASQFVSLAKWAWQTKCYAVLFALAVMLIFAVMNKMSWAPTIPTKYMELVAFLTAALPVLAINILVTIPPTVTSLVTALVMALGTGVLTTKSYDFGAKKLGLAHPESSPAPVAPAAPAAPQA